LKVEGLPVEGLGKLDLELGEGESLVLGDRGGLASRILQCVAELIRIKDVRIWVKRGTRKLYLTKPDGLHPKWTVEKLLRHFKRIGKLNEALFLHEMNHLGLSVKTRLEELSEEMKVFLFGVLGVAMKVDLILTDAITDIMGAGFTERFLPLLEQKKKNKGSLLIASANPLPLLKLSDRMVLLKDRRVIFNGTIDQLSSFQQVVLPGEAKGIERFRLFSPMKTQSGVNALIADKATLHALKSEYGEDVSAQNVKVEEVIRRLLA